MRIVIAEDLVLLRDGMARMLEADGFEVIAGVGDAASLMAVVDRELPDLAIVDVRMPPTFTSEGARAVVELRSRHPGLAVVVLSHTIEPELATDLAARRPDRFGYLLKDRVVDTTRFAGVLRHVAAGGTAIDQDVVEYYLRAARVPRSAPFTAREREVLGLIAEGFSNLGIAERLHLSERTVDTHVRSLFAKLDLPLDPAGNRRVQATLRWLRDNAVVVPVVPGVSTDGGDPPAP